MADSTPFPGLTRRGLLTALGSSLAVGAFAQGGPPAIEPEGFGARGDGTGDDAPAIEAAFAAAGSRGAPVVLRAHARYVLGRPGWGGLRVQGGLEIRGNDATLMVRALPSQGLPAGIGNALIRVEGGTVAVSNTQFDLGGLPVASLVLHGCDVRIEGCGFANGHLSNRSYGTFLARCRGIIRNNRGQELGHLFYVGHTDTGMQSRDLRIIGNRARALAADFVVGTFSDSVIEDNECDGMFGGVGMSGYAGTGARSENILVTGNRFYNFRAQGIQTDIVGEIFNRNLQVRNNHLRGGGPASAGIFMLRVDGFEVVQNRIEDVELGIVVDAARNGTVRLNQIFAGTRRPIRAIGMVAAHGDIRSVRLLENVGEGFGDGIILEGQRGRVSEIEISGNRFAGGSWGVRSTTGVSGVTVSDNVFRGNRERAIQVGPGVSLGANRQED